MEEERNVLRWGGVAGLVAGILFVLTIVVAITALPPDAGPETPVVRFPDIKAALTVVEGLYLTGLVLWVALLLALYRALRGAGLAPALGSVLGVLGVAMLAVGSLVYVALAHVAGLYHRTGATPEEQESLLLIWQAIQGVFSATDAVGLLLLPIGLIVLGMAMVRTPTFGRRFGTASGVVAVVGVVGMSLFVVEPLSSIGLAGIFLGATVALVIFPLLLGWKVYRLSRTSAAG